MGEVGEHQADFLSSSAPEAKTSSGSEHGQNDDSMCTGTLALQSGSFESHWLQSSQTTSRLVSEDTEEELPPEEVTVEELPETSGLSDTLGRDLEVEVVEMRWVLGPDGQLGAGRRQMMTHRSVLVIMFFPVETPSFPEAGGAVGGFVLLWALAHSSHSGNTGEESEHRAHSPNSLRRWSWLLPVPWLRAEFLDSVEPG